MTVVNAKPRPSAIFIGFDEDELNDAGILKHFPTYTVLEDSDELDTVRQSEFDVVIATEIDDLGDVNSPLFVLSIGGDKLGYSKQEDNWHELSVTKRNSVAAELTIKEMSDKKLLDLITKTLIPKYESERQHDTIQSVKIYSDTYKPKSELWLPLVEDGDGEIFSGVAIRDHKLKSEHWHLHISTTNIELNQWLEYLIPHWSTIKPESFSKESEWAKNPKWQLSTEIELAKSIDQLDTKFSQQQKTYTNTREELKKKLIQEAENVERSVRRLLKSQGDDLKDEVLSTFSYLGFEMTDVDKEKEAQETKADKLEDLRAEFEQEEHWTALIEVRGYIKGARTSDLQRIGRFARRYLKDKGQEADAHWYVVNHDFKKNPEGRQLALKESKEDVENFAEDNGLVIDTVELFKLRKAVDDKELTLELARNLLMNATGYFTYSKPKETPVSK